MTDIKKEIQELFENCSPSLSVYPTHQNTLSVSSSTLRDACDSEEEAWIDECFDKEDGEFEDEYECPASLEMRKIFHDQ
jgi:hypothetical protein